MDCGSPAKMAWDIKRWTIGYRMPGTTRPGGSKALRPLPWKLAGCLLIGLAFSGSARAAAEMGPSSSASIRISVSVAPRYALRLATAASPVRLQHVEPSQFCLETNAIALHLPVMLIWLPGHAVSPSGPTARDNTVEVLPCGSHPGMVQAVSQPDQLTSGMLIVRPE